jgi:hypothetical protein
MYWLSKENKRRLCDTYPTGLLKTGVFINALMWSSSLEMLPKTLVVACVVVFRTLGAFERRILRIFS